VTSSAKKLPFRSEKTRSVNPRGGTPSKANDVLKFALRRLGVEQDIARYSFVLHWKDIVGDSIAKRSRPESLKNGILRVRVCDSVWAQELSFHKTAILARLAKHVGEGTKLKDVVFFVGDLKA